MENKQNDSEENKPTQDYPVGEAEEELKIQSILDMTKLLKLMECPICNEIPFPPIHMCKNGHIVCKDCRPKLNICGVCRESFGSGRNFPLEGIILGSSFSCSYKDFGCQEVILGADFADHLKRCKFSPFFVMCNEQRGTPCNDVKVGANDYLEHLRKVHNCYTEIQKSQSRYIFLQLDDPTKPGQFINTDYFEHEGEAFLQKWQFQDGVYYTWICILNMAEAKLEGWKAIVTLRYQDSSKKFSSVLALQEASKDLSEVKATGSFMCIFPSQIKAFDGTGTRFYVDRKWELCWHSDIQLKRQFGTRGSDEDDEDW